MYHFIVDPNAQGGKGIRIWKKLESRLKRACVEYQAYLTGQCGDAVAIASQLTGKGEEPGCIVVVGNDGTLGDVLEGLSLSPATTLGYVSVGFTHNFARSIRLPRKARSCLKHILNPRQIKMIDYGVITYGDGKPEHRRFLLSAGIGPEGAFQDRDFRQGRGRILRWLHMDEFLDMIVGIKQILKFTPVKGYLLLDGTKKVEFTRLYFITANIHPIASGGFKMAPRPSYGDGKLAVCVIHGIAKYHLIPLCLRAKWWNLNKERGVRYYECREAAIHLEEPRPVHVDGVNCPGQTDLHIRCIERKLRLIR